MRNNIITYGSALLVVFSLLAVNTLPAFGQGLSTTTNSQTTTTLSTNTSTNTTNPIESTIEAISRTIAQVAASLTSLISQGGQTPEAQRQINDLLKSFSQTLKQLEKALNPGGNRSPGSNNSGSGSFGGFPGSNQGGLSGLFNQLFGGGQQGGQGSNPLGGLLGGGGSNPLGGLLGGGGGGSNPLGGLLGGGGGGGCSGGLCPGGSGGGGCPGGLCGATNPNSGGVTNPNRFGGTITKPQNSQCYTTDQCDAKKEKVGYIVIDDQMTPSTGGSSGGCSGGICPLRPPATPQNQTKSRSLIVNLNTAQTTTIKDIQELKPGVYVLGSTNGGRDACFIKDPDCRRVIGETVQVIDKGVR